MLVAEEITKRQAPRIFVMYSDKECLFASILVFFCLKCDDHRPCSRCVARSEECVHVSRGPKLVKLRCEGCREDNKRCEESRPCKYCVENLKECIVVPRKGRGHGTRVKAVRIFLLGLGVY